MTTVDNADQPLRAASDGLLARHPLVFYFLIAFAFSWLMFLPGVLTYYGVLSISPSIIGLMGIAGLLGPSLSGFIMTGITEGRAGIRRLLRRICCGGSGFCGTCSLSSASRWLWCSPR
jgi:hypothetical protein